MPDYNLMNSYGVNSTKSATRKVSDFILLPDCVNESTFLPNTGSL